MKYEGPWSSAGKRTKEERELALRIEKALPRNYIIPPYMKRVLPGIENRSRHEVADALALYILNGTARLLGWDLSFLKS